MRLIGLLNFYDEQPRDLVMYVASLRQATVDHLVAVDGAYALFPDGKPASRPEQRGALIAACAEAGIGLTLHTPAEVWTGNEPEKRRTLFALANSVAPGDDWFVVLDTDELIREVPSDFRSRLETSEHDCALVTMCDTMALAANKPNWPSHFTQRRLFRKQPISLGRSHSEYLRLDGTVIGLDPSPDPVLDLCDLVVWHVPQRRVQERDAAKRVYYGAVKESGVELGKCACGQQATAKMEAHWRWSDLGPLGGPVASLVEVCPRCAKRARNRNVRDLRAMGVDPASVTVAYRYGPVPA